MQMKKVYPNNKTITFFTGPQDPGLLYATVYMTIVVKDMIISISRVWNKEKNLVPDRIQTYDLPNTGRANLKLTNFLYYLTVVVNWVTF